jgi:hypothetical protein
MKFVLAGCRSRSKASGAPLDLDIVYLVDLYQKQNNRCTISGLKFHLDPPAPRPSPYSPSIDRIDPRKGYVKGNVHFVLFAINIAKSEWQIKELLPIWGAAVKHSRKR